MTDAGKVKSLAARIEYVARQFSLDFIRAELLEQAVVVRRLQSTSGVQRYAEIIGTERAAELSPDDERVCVEEKCRKLAWSVVSSELLAWLWFLDRIPPRDMQHEPLCLARSGPTGWSSPPNRGS